MVLNVFKHVVVSWEIDKNVIRWTILYMLIRLK